MNAIHKAAAGCHKATHNNAEVQSCTDSKQDEVTVNALQMKLQQTILVCFWCKVTVQLHTTLHNSTCRISCNIEAAEGDLPYLLIESSSMLANKPQQKVRMCFTWHTSLTTVAACLRTSSSGNLRQVRILGKTSASTTTSAMSTLCLAI